MKRIISAWLCLCVMLLGAVGLCEAGAGDISEAIRLQLGQQTIRLDFDSSEKFSAVSDGLVQASFYTYGDTKNQLYELYMVFPENVTPGTTVTPEYAMQGYPDTMVTLIVTNGSSESFYYAGLVNGEPYPNQSAYSIAFESVSTTDVGTTYTGTLTASLMGVGMINGETVETVTITGAPFSFTMPAANRKLDAPAASQSPENPQDFPDIFEATPDPMPSPTPVQTWRV